MYKPHNTSNEHNLSANTDVQYVGCSDIILLWFLDAHHVGVYTPAALLGDFFGSTSPVYVAECSYMYTYNAAVFVEYHVGRDCQIGAVYQYIMDKRVMGVGKGGGWEGDGFFQQG